VFLQPGKTVSWLFIHCIWHSGSFFGRIFAGDLSEPRKKEKDLNLNFENKK